MLDTQRQWLIRSPTARPKKRPQHAEKHTEMRALSVSGMWGRRWSDRRQEIQTPPQPCPPVTHYVAQIFAWLHPWFKAAQYRKLFNGSLCEWALCYPRRRLPTLRMWVSAGFDKFSSISKTQVTWSLPSAERTKSTVRCERNMLRCVVCIPTAHC
jgi:hypothetical protein